MNRINLVVLSILVGFVFTILAIPGFAQEEKMEQQMEQQKGQMMQKKGEMMQKMGKMQTIEGKILCVEADQKGQVTAEEKSKCNGVSVVVGKDGKLYTLSGSEQQMKKMPMMAMEGKVSGTVEGSQSAWIIYAAGAKPSEKPVEKTVKGTILCLLPDYAKGTVKPVVASGPCNEMEPHAHVVYTEDGQIYALEGSEEAIQKMQMNPERKGVTVKGKLQGNPGAWVLFVE
jgi:hypothetical protein